jgi:hypothetical protein
MAALTLEEQGLLLILERIKNKTFVPGPAVRAALLQRQLVAPGSVLVLTAEGERCLFDLRRRAATRAHASARSPA